ncbi:hypothetical protein ACL9RL_07555 [Plantibacter sp. Mn2098]|uniref:hypothetical protein n=1 Tax=Plantibacter sp. Mn2098 TaxID=3395266 RepID=UPI003BE62B24
MTNLDETAAAAPIRTDDEVEARFAELVGRAIVRRIWFGMIGPDGIQVPVLLPISDFPESFDDEEMVRFGEGLAGIAAGCGAETVVIVAERPGPVALDSADRRLLGGVRAGCLANGAEVRAVLLSHDHGVRLVSLDELAG